jgi:two-component system sensor histidine kinase KdpD
MAPTLSPSERLLVCVGPSPTSPGLVHAARQLANRLRVPWVAVYVETPASAAMPARERDGVTQTLRLAEQLGGEAVTLAGTRASEELLAYARTRNVRRILVGKRNPRRWWERLRGGSIVDELIRDSGDIEICVVRGEVVASGAPGAPEQSGAGRRAWREYAWSVVSVAIATGAAYGLYALLHYTPQSDLSNLVMFYLLAVMLVAIRFGRGPAILASLLSTAAFDFFFVPPFFTFAVTDTQYFITFGVMLVVAIVISALTDRVRGQAEMARRRERRSAALLVLSRRLAETRDTAAIGEAAVSEVADVFDAQAVVLVPDSAGVKSLVARAARTRGFAVAADELAAARWVFEHGEAAGNGTATMPHVAGFYLPLAASRGTVGVLAVRPSARSRLQNPEQIRLLEAFASQTAAAMERANLADETRAAWERVEVEFLRNTLLSSVSHDLRTPLAAISGAAGTLLQADGTLDTDTRRDLTETVLDESRRMERLISNLLDMTRLESGGLQLKREWQPLAEVVGAALHQMEARLANRQVRVDLPGDLPLVNIDEVSMEQVLVNLLDNAVEYTPVDGALDITARGTEASLVLEIGDRGPGIAAGKEEQIFQKFFRSHPSGGRRGIGLGLAICRGIVEAHGGTITASNRSDAGGGRGAVFRIELPVAGAPKVVET